MRILITGAGGNLGRVLAPALKSAGYEPVLLDYRNIDTSYEFIRADIRNLDEIIKATKNVDVIVHAAALHGIHLSHYGAEDFWQLNVTGTHNVFQAAIQNNVSKVIYCSSIDVYGDGIPTKEDRYVQGAEYHTLKPNHIYGLTKKLGEETAEFYYRVHGLSTICLRLGMFVAASDMIFYGFRLLGGGVDERDVAEAFLAAIQNNDIKYEVFNIVSDVPFSTDDEKELFLNPELTIEKYYPGAKRIFEKHQINVKEHMDIWGSKYWANDKAKAILGFQPKYNFGRFLQALQDEDYSYYPFAGLPWWGINK